jgi:glutathione S-transferase
MFSQLNSLLADGRPFLTGDEFTEADLTDIAQVERPSFHLVAILGSNQSFFG